MPFDQGKAVTSARSVCYTESSGATTDPTALYTLLKTGDVVVGMDGAPDRARRRSVPEALHVPARTRGIGSFTKSGSRDGESRTSVTRICVHIYRSSTRRLRRGSHSLKLIPVGDVGRITDSAPPLPEQRRIVAEIEKQFTRLDARRRGARSGCRPTCERYRASVLKAALRGPAGAPGSRTDRAGGCACWRASWPSARAKWEAEHPGKKYVEPAAPATDGLPELPEGWCWTSVEQIGEVTGGLTKNQKRDVYLLDCLISEWQTCTPMNCAWMICLRLALKTVRLNGYYCKMGICLWWKETAVRIKLDA